MNLGMHKIEPSKSGFLSPDPFLGRSLLVYQKAQCEMIEKL